MAKAKSKASSTPTLPGKDFQDSELMAIGRDFVLLVDELSEKKKKVKDKQDDLITAMKKHKVSSFKVEDRRIKFKHTPEKDAIEVKIEKE
jgi:hypothetical protein